MRAKLRNSKLPVAWVVKGEAALGWLQNYIIFQDHMYPRFPRKGEVKAFPELL
jgi:hypothetical protein